MMIWSSMRELLTEEFSGAVVRDFLSGLFRKLGGDPRDGVIIFIAGDSPLRVEHARQSQCEERAWDPAGRCFGTRDQHLSLVTAARELLVFVDVPEHLRFSFEIRVAGSAKRNAREIVENNFSSWSPFPVEEVFYSIGNVQGGGQTIVIPVVYAPRNAVGAALEDLEAAGLHVDGLVIGGAGIRPVLSDWKSLLRKAARRNRRAILGLLATVLALASLIAWDARLGSALEQAKHVNAMRTASVRALRAQFESLPGAVPEISPSGAVRLLAGALPEGVDIQSFEVTATSLSVVVASLNSDVVVEALRQKFGDSARITSRLNGANLEIVIAIRGEI